MPERLTMHATKPKGASEKLYLVNLERTPLDFSIACITSDHGGVFTATPANGTIPKSSKQEITLIASSAGVREGSHDVELLVHSTSYACADENGGDECTAADAHLTLSSVPVTLKIIAAPDPNQTVVKVHGQPTLDDVWKALRIELRDSDGWPIVIHCCPSLSSSSVEGVSLESIDCS